MSTPEEALSSKPTELFEKFSKSMSEIVKIVKGYLRVKQYTRSILLIDSNLIR